VWSGTGGAHRQQTSPVCPGPVRVDMQLLATMLVPFVRGRPTPKQCRYRPVSRRLSRWWHSARAGEALWLRQAPPPETVVSIYASIGGLFWTRSRATSSRRDVAFRRSAARARPRTYGAPVRLRARVWGSSECRLTRDARGRPCAPPRPRGGDVVLHACFGCARPPRFARTRVLACDASCPGRVGGWHTDRFNLAGVVYPRAPRVFPRRQATFTLRRDGICARGLWP
jgi:hypothetical protein